MDSLSGTSIITNTILEWYRKNCRNLPWRQDPTPYKVWLSEIILQQTRVEQGLPYYLKIVKTFPTLKDLANAPLDELLKCWQGLGYYSRAKNMHTAAKQVVTDFGGDFPNSYEELLLLKGVGEYTASAIASICFAEPKAVVDGNVYRVLSRVFGIDTPINSSQGIKQFRNLAQHLLDLRDPSNSNQAMMEFGAMQCIPSNPNCTNCPLSTRCIANEKMLVNILPYKKPSKSKQERYLVYLYLTDGRYTLLQQRTNKDIWQNLWEFPLIENEKAFTVEDILISGQLGNLIPKPFNLGTPLYFKHILSHRVVHATFLPIQVENVNPIGNAIKIELTQLKNYAIPRLIEKFLEKQAIIRP